MKRLITTRFAGALFAGAVLALASAAANAAGTAVGTSISNQATVNFKVGSVAQTPITSDPVTFKVDDKVVLTVTKLDATIVTVSPGQATAVLRYTVTNGGNAPHGVIFTTAHPAGATNPFTGQPDDNFTPTGIQVFVDGNDNGTYEATDTATAISTLAAGATSKTIFVVADIPATQVDGDSAVLALGATATDDGTTTPVTDESGSTWTAGTVQHIFADGAGSDDVALDGKFSVRDAFLVQSAQLSIAKTSIVISDPTGAAIPHAIPGAVMQYTITVTNAAGATQDATDIAVSDSLDTEIATNGTLAWKTGQLTLTAPGVNGGAALTCADDGTTVTTDGSVSCDFNKTADNTVTVSGLTLAPGTSGAIVFQVTIQ